MNELTINGVMHVVVGELVISTHIVQDELFIGVDGVTYPPTTLIRELLANISNSMKIGALFRGVSFTEPRASVEGGLHTSAEGVLLAVSVSRLELELERLIRDIEHKQVGHVYVMENSIGDIKIGSSKKPRKRLSNTQTGNSENVNLIHSIEVYGYKKVEALLHKSYSSSRTEANNEWFRGLDIAKVIERLDSIKNADQMLDTLAYRRAHSIIKPSNNTVEEHLNSTYRNPKSPVAYEDEDKLATTNINLEMPDLVSKDATGVAIFNYKKTIELLEQYYTENKSSNRDQ